MDFIAVVVAVLMRPNKMLPKMRYSGKCSMLNLNMYENTAVMTTIMRSGLSTDHTIPRTLRRYFILKSLETSAVSTPQFFLNSLRVISLCAFDAISEKPLSKPAF